MDDCSRQDSDKLFLQENSPEPLELLQGEKRRIIQPACLTNPNLLKLKERLVSWINSTLKQEHIVVQILEEDLYDGLVLHHMLRCLAGVQLPLEEIAVTSVAQIRKLGVILESLNQKLGVQDDSASKWSVSLIHSKDLLATLHLLVAMARRFQPDLQLPAVTVEVVMVEVTKSGIKSEKTMEKITEARESADDSGSDPAGGNPIDELLKLEPHKVDTVKKAIIHFANKKMTPLGIEVTDMDRQFSDGVMLLLLIGQVEGYFVPLCDFYLAPTSSSEMEHNVALALALLNDCNLNVPNLDPKDIVLQDVAATLKVLYVLFKKHKSK